MGRIVHNDPSCRVCAAPEGALVRAASRVPSALPNPRAEFGEGGPDGTYWYHGTRRAFDGPLRTNETDYDSDDLYHQRYKHWNTDLGIHFTSEHGVAKNFAQESTMTPREHSRIAHASLHMVSPIHYPSEHDMADEAVNLARDHGLLHGYDPDQPEFEDIDEHGPEEHMMSTKDDWISAHPQRKQVIELFAKRLRSQGHDGVTYGNEYEGPVGHTSAIAFPETPVTVHRWQYLHGAHPQHEGARKAAAETTSLGFESSEQDTGGSKRPTLVTLTGVHPDHGPVGFLRYYVPRRKADKILVDRLEVDPEHRGHGYASQLMDEMQNRHPKTPIDHGDRTPDGTVWWANYSKGKPVRNGRTATADRIWFHGTRPESVADIRQRGLDKSNSDWDLRLTDSRDQAAAYAGRGGKVLEYRLPADHPALGTEHPHNMLGVPDARAVSLSQRLPGDHIVAEHDVPDGKTASELASNHDEAVAATDNDVHSVHHYMAEDVANKYVTNRQFAAQPEAQSYVHGVMDKEGLDDHVPQVQFYDHPTVSGMGYHKTTGKPYMLLGHGMRNEWTILHELTHHMRTVNGQSPADDPDHRIDGFGDNLAGMLKRHHSDPQAARLMSRSWQAVTQHAREHPEQFPEPAPDDAVGHIILGRTPPRPTPPRTAARDLPCHNCDGTGRRSYGDRSWDCNRCGGTGTFHAADDWAKPTLPPEQADALDDPDYRAYKHKSLELAKNPVPGTQVWRGEIRHKDDIVHPTSVGMHWTVDPDQAILGTGVTPEERGLSSDHRHVLWQATVDHPDQTIPRSHPIWTGRHQSLDSEAEVRFKPGATVHVNGAYSWAAPGQPEATSPYPLHPDRTPAGWAFHPLDHHVTIEHKSAQGDLMHYQESYPDLFGKQTKTAAAEPFSFEYARNTEKSPNFGGLYGQDIEPHGRYLTQREPSFNYGDDDRWETGRLTFHNPKHMDFGGGYSEDSNWKRQLSQEYGGKRGRALSRAVVKDGHDGIVTHDEDGTREIVDLTSFYARKESHHVREAGKGKPRRDAPDVAQGAGQADQDQQGGMGPDSGRDADGAGAQDLAPLVEHPRVASDLKKLPKKIQGVYRSRVDDLRRGVSHSSTHALGQPLKGWTGTSLNFQFRMVHRNTPDGLEVISAANHDEAYDQALRRGAAAADPWEDIRTASRPDWNAIQAEHQSVHRGFALPDLSDEDYNFVHDTSRPLHERASHLLRLARGHEGHGWGRDRATGLGTHWSTDANVAHHFAKTDAREQQKYDWQADGEAYGYDGDFERHRPETRLVLHAHFPEPEHIADDASEQHGGVFDWDKPTDLGGLYEREIPIKSGAPVRVHAISWGKTSHMSESEAPYDRETTHYDFADPQIHTAGAGRICEGCGGTGDVEGGHECGACDGSGRDPDCPCGLKVRKDGDEWVHLDGSVSHDLPWEGSVSDLMRTATYFHNTFRDLNPGDELKPAAELGLSDRWPEDAYYSPHHVYMWHSDAMNHEDLPDVYHEEFGDHRYEVEPIGGAERDPERGSAREYERSQGTPDDEPLASDFTYRAPRARVVRKVSAQANPLPGDDDSQVRGEIYWRTHHKDAPFGPEHADSYDTGGSVDDPVSDGYSCFHNPHDLHRYVHDMDWVGSPEVDWNERRVYGFRGVHHGRGMDGEDLVIPLKDKPEHNMAWSTFARRLKGTPGQASWSLDQAHTAARARQVDWPAEATHSELEKAVPGYAKIAPRDRQALPGLKKDTRFTYHAAYPLHLLDHQAESPEDLGDEDDDKIDGYHRLQRALVDEPHTVPPLVIWHHPKHGPQILDGNHRASLALEEDVPHLHAYVAGGGEPVAPSAPPRGEKPALCRRCRGSGRILADPCTMCDATGYVGEPRPGYIAARRRAARSLPSQRLFGPTFGLDHRLFDGDKLRPNIRADILSMFGGFCAAHGYGGWLSWAKVYFAGSEASRWTSPSLVGNSDFDILVGVKYDQFRRDNPQHSGLSDEDISTRLTKEMHEALNNPQYHPPT